MVANDWNLLTLGEVITLQRGYDLPFRDRRAGDIPVVTSAGINGTHAEAQAKGPGVVTGRYGTIGEVFFINEDYWPHNTTLYVRDFKGNDPLFISYLLHTIDLQSFSGKSGVPGVNRNDLHEVEVRIPALPEQRAIAAALSDMDALITALDRLIAKKRDIKQAAMQELLTGKRRLPGFGGEWEDHNLSSIGKFSKGKGIKKDETVTDGFPCIRYGEIYTRHNDYIRKFYSFISPEIAKQSQRINKGDLLFTGSGETAEGIGKCVAFLGDEEVYAGGDIVIFTPSNHNSLYLGYLMNHTSIVAQRSSMAQGDAIVHISAQKLGQLQLHLPLIDEQQAIAEVLSDLDAEIAALEQQRDKTRLLKQGMMQELLTGRIRLV
jgi:type I restriction enzyme, S subunit